MTATDEATDAAFEEFGETATYTPVAGPPRSVLYLRVPVDQIWQPQGSGVPGVGVYAAADARDAYALMVRTSELAESAEGDVIATADGRTRTVEGVPTCENGLWTIHARLMG